MVMMRPMTHEMSQLELITDWGGDGPHGGCRGSTPGDCTRLTAGCLGKDPKLGKGGIKVVWGGTRGKIKG